MQTDENKHEKETTAAAEKVSRISVVSILVTDRNAAEKVNGALSLYGGYIIGRMGLPYRERGVNIISVVLDAPQDVISALSGRMGRLEGVSAKTLYSNVITPIEDR